MGCAWFNTRFKPNLSGTCFIFVFEDCGDESWKLEPKVGTLSFGELGQARWITRQFPWSPHLNLILMLNVMRYSIIFFEKTKLAKCIRRPAEILLVRPLLAFLLPLCTALGKSSKWLRASPTSFMKLFYIWTSMFSFEYF